MTWLFGIWGSDMERAFDASSSEGRVSNKPNNLGANFRTPKGSIYVHQ